MFVARRRLHVLNLDRRNGNSSHYFHFICDVVLPLFFYVRLHAARLRDDPVVVLRDEFVRHYRSLLSEMFDVDLVIPSVELNATWPVRFRVLIGSGTLVLARNTYLRALRSCNPRYHGYRDHGMSEEQFGDGVREMRAEFGRRLGIPSPPRDTVTLVERESRVADRGATRRSITNHDELRSRLEAACRGEGIQFRNVMLEGLSFREQFELFGRTRVLVGQHGAGLVNLLWMDADDAGVVELDVESDPTHNHFERLAGALGMRHVRVPCERQPSADDVQILRADVERVAGVVESALRSRGAAAHAARS